MFYSLTGSTRNISLLLWNFDVVSLSQGLLVVIVMINSTQSTFVISEFLVLLKGTVALLQVTFWLRCSMSKESFLTTSVQEIAVQDGVSHLSIRAL